MKIDLSQYSFDEVVSLKNQCESFINSYEDGYLYICEVRSYGRNWKQDINNIHELERLCYQYDGYDGIVDVYSNNPDLSNVHNYGDLMYIKSQEDYDKWKALEYLKKNIEETQDDLDKWDNRDNVPFRDRPYFEPIYSHEDLEKMKKQLVEYDMSFVPPKPYSN